jgi:hypothetical protein
MASNKVSNEYFVHSVCELQSPVPGAWHQESDPKHMFGALSPKTSPKCHTFCIVVQQQKFKILSKL